MKCFAQWCLAAAIAGALPASGVFAQSIQSPLVVLKNGKQLDNEPLVFGSIDDCVGEGANFEFKATYPQMAPIVEAWVGVGADCSSAANRKRASAAAARPVCKQLGIDKSATLRPSIKVNAKDLFSREWDLSDEAPECDEQRNQEYTLYFVPLQTETILAADTAAEPLTAGGLRTLTATFTLFTLPPTPPSNVRAITGESRIGVKFDQVSGSLPRTQYRAYFDWGEGDADAGAECGSGELKEGGRAPDSREMIASETVNGSEAFLGSLDARGIPIGGKVAVSVVTVDIAKNEGPLTAPVCVERVETLSFTDRCAADPECANGFDSCSITAPGLRSGGLFGISLLLGLGVALGVRKRRQM